MLLFAPFGATAQDRSYQLRHLDGAEAMTGLVQKSIHQLLAGDEYKGRASFHEDRVKIRVHELSAEQVVDLLNSMDLGTFQLVTDLENPELPVKIDTGDPAADEAAYQQAKQEWIDAHQEEYQQMIGGAVEQQEKEPFHQPEQ